MSRTLRISVTLLILLSGMFLATLPAPAHVEVAYSLGSVIQQSSNIVLMRLEKIDKERNLLIYRKVRDLKGTHGGDVIKHNVGRGGFHPRDWQNIMAWAEVGKLAVFFYVGGQSETCIDNYWYQMNSAGEWWQLTHAEPYFLRSYCGRADKLATFVTDMLAGKEVIVPCMVDGNKEDLHLRKAKIQRLRASMKIQDYNPKRDFVGWGGDDMRRLSGVPGFSHLGTLGRVDPEVHGVSIADMDSDGKPDVILAGASRVLLLQNNGDGFGEISLSGLSGARSSAWADYNGDGLLDLLLATPNGPKLYTNRGMGVFTDDSEILPPESSYHTTCAAWLDQDGDGKTDILLGNGYHGLRLYRNQPPADTGKSMTPPVLGDWYICGPFDSTGNKGFSTVYPPEKEINLTKTYTGKANTTVNWKKHGFKDGAINNLALFNKGELNNEAVVYLFREITCATPAELPISLGSDDTLTVWLNGERLFAENVHRAVAPDQAKLTLKLKAGKNQFLLKICQGSGEWAYYFAPGKPTLKLPQWFQDVTKEVGLAGDYAVGHSLSVADVNGDGRADFIYGTSEPLLFINRATGFQLAQGHGLDYNPQGVGVAWGDFDGDGHLDLFVPQRDGPAKLYRNNGQGRFQNLWPGLPLGQAVCTAWGDFDNDGRLDLVVGCLRGPNRFLRNLGGGKFTDVTETIGLNNRIFNTQAVALADLNGDGNLDVVFNNDGQESVVLLGASPASAGRSPVSLSFKRPVGLVGSQVRILAEGERVVASLPIGVTDGRGGQISWQPRFTLTPGKYSIETRDTAGQVRRQDLTVTMQPLRVLVD